MTRNPFHFLLAACSPHDEDQDHMESSDRPQVSSVNRAARAHSGQSPESHLPPPPSYAVFDPHPPECACPIHIHQSHPLRPTIVESFQSHGCSSCPPTNTQLLNLLTSADPNVLVLNYHVTYWDHLGWPDTFGRKAHDDRQWEYARAMGKMKVYTPQVLVNGAVEGIGNTKAGLEDLIKRGNERASSGPPWTDFEAVADGVLIKGGEGRTGRVLEVIYDPAMQEVEIKKGENRGRTLPVRNVVKSLKVKGDWVGGSQIVRVAQKPDDGLERVLLVQEGYGGAIVGAVRV